MSCYWNPCVQYYLHLEIECFYNHIYCVSAYSLPFGNTADVVGANVRFRAVSIPGRDRFYAKQGSSDARHLRQRVARVPRPGQWKIANYWCYRYYFVFSQSKGTLIMMIFTFSYKVIHVTLKKRFGRNFWNSQCINSDFLHLRGVLLRTIRLG